jgi:hypothetical protein
MLPSMAASAARRGEFSMRLAVALLMLPLLAGAAGAQDRSVNASSLSNLSAADAARLNQAAQSDPQARQALDKVEKSLNDAGHRSGQLLEKTRP